MTVTAKIAYLGHGDWLHNDTLNDVVLVESVDGVLSIKYDKGYSIFTIPSFRLIKLEQTRADDGS